MRILLLVDKYIPSPQSCAQLMHDLGEELSKLGHEVLLTTADPTLAVRRQVTQESEMTVIRVRSGRLRGVPLPLRAYNEWRLPAVLWNGAHDIFRKRPCHLIVQYCPPILLGPLTRRLKRLWASQVYLVLRDIFPQWSVDAGVLREGSLPHRLLCHYERSLYAAADLIGVQSERNLDYFQAEVPQNKYRLEVLHNWASTEGRTFERSRLRQDLGLEDRVVFLYGGNLGVAQDASCIVRLADALREHPRAFFLVVGDGSDSERLEIEAAARGLDNLHFLPPADHAAYLGMVDAADVGLMTLRRDLKTHNHPGKMLDYFYFGKPILAAINPGNDLKDLLETRRAGLVCWNGDLDSLYRSSLRLLKDEQLRQELGRNGRKLLETTFSAERAARQILSRARIGDSDGC